MQTDEVARALIKGMGRGTFLIIPGFDGKFTFLAKRLLPWLVDFIMSRDIRKIELRILAPSGASHNRINIYALVHGLTSLISHDQFRN
jgi:hypothetical protein